MNRADASPASRTDSPAFAHASARQRSRAHPDEPAATQHGDLVVIDSTPLDVLVFCGETAVPVAAPVRIEIELCAASFDLVPLRAVRMSDRRLR